MLGQRRGTEIDNKIVLGVGGISVRIRCHLWNFSNAHLEFAFVRETRIISHFQFASQSHSQICLLASAERTKTAEPHRGMTWRIASCLRSCGGEEEGADVAGCIKREMNQGRIGRGRRGVVMS